MKTVYRLGKVLDVINRLPLIIAGVLTMGVLSAQQQVITTVAGTDWFFPASTLPALNAPLGRTQAVAVDSKGNIYVADSDNNMVMRISPDGILTVVAGNGFGGYSGDGGPATSAAVNAPSSLAVDNNGNLYITTYFRVRKFLPMELLRQSQETVRSASPEMGDLQSTPPCTLRELPLITLATFILRSGLTIESGR